MSVYAVWHLYCNGAPGVYCGTEYKPADPLADAGTGAKLRKLAAKDGWTYVPWPGLRGYGRDYCPEHKPEGAAS